MLNVLVLNFISSSLILTAFQNLKTIWDCHCKVLLNLIQRVQFLCMHA